MSFKPQPSYSGYLLLGLTLATAVGVWWMSSLLLQQNTPPALFTAAMGLIVLLAVTLLLLYGTITAFSLTYQAMDRTLTDEEVNRLLAHIQERLEKDLGARLRA